MEEKCYGQGRGRMGGNGVGGVAQRQESLEWKEVKEILHGWIAEWR